MSGFQLLAAFSRQRPSKLSCKLREHAGKISLCEINLR